jgi:NAD(P)-dependent dehydrogenase (short-subunit alcohol dehydrogenase family)
MELAGRAALVTGGRRMGVAVAHALATRGADVALAYNRSRDEAEAAAATARGLGRRAVALQADLTRDADCETLVARAAESLGRLDVLVHMASVYVRAPFDRLDVRELDRALGVEVRAGFLCARAAVPHMRAAGGGRIVTIADWLARSGRPRYIGFLPYYVAKAAVVALTEALALELAADRILVNAIAPGPILPPPDLTDEERATVERETPLGRWGGEEAIARAVVSLVETDFMTGETVRVDGGRHLR